MHIGVHAPTSSTTTGRKKAAGGRGDNGYPALIIENRIHFTTLTHPLCSTLINEGTHVPHMIHNPGVFVRLLLFAILLLPSLRSARNGRAD